MTDKPHRGRITDWRKFEFGGYSCIIGKLLDHPTLGKHGGPSKTSVLVKHDEDTGEIETMNSRYTLVGPELPPLSG